MTTQKIGSLLSSRLSFPIRRWLRWGFYAFVMFGSFFLTLWLTEPDDVTSNDRLDSRTGAELLARQTIKSYDDVHRAARAAGLRLSRRMRGSVDGVTRLSPQEVAVAGWLADPDGDASAQALVAFAGGANVAIGQTSGERPDVTRAISLGFGAEKNVSFQIKFKCQPGQQAVLVGVGASRQYLPLQLSPCP